MGVKPRGHLEWEARRNEIDGMTNVMYLNSLHLEFFSLYSGLLCCSFEKALVPVYPGKTSFFEVAKQRGDLATHSQWKMR